MKSSRFEPLTLEIPPVPGKGIGEGDDKGSRGD